MTAPPPPDLLALATMFESAISFYGDVVPLHITPDEARLCARVLREAQERTEAPPPKADLNALALWEALEEMRWPELPEIPYAAELVDAQTGETKVLALRPEQVKGIFTALRKHAATLMPHAVQISQDAQRVIALQNRVKLLEAQSAAPPLGWVVQSDNWPNTHPKLFWNDAGDIERAHRSAADHDHIFPERGPHRVVAVYAAPPSPTPPAPRGMTP